MLTGQMIDFNKRKTSQALHSCKSTTLIWKQGKTNEKYEEILWTILVLFSMFWKNSLLILSKTI